MSPPPLPQAVGWAGLLWDGGPRCEVYTADQMRAYAAACVTMATRSDAFDVAAAVEKCAALCVSQYPEYDGKMIACFDTPTQCAAAIRATLAP